MSRSKLPYGKWKQNITSNSNNSLHFVFVVVVGVVFPQIKYLTLKFSEFQWNHIFQQGDFPGGRQFKPYRLGMTAPRAPAHVQPLHPWCVHSTFLSKKSKQPLLRFQIFLTKPMVVYNSSLTRQLVLSAVTVFCKLSLQLSSAPHLLSNPKRIMHYKLFQSGRAPTKPTQMLLPKLLQPVQAESDKLHS